MRLRWKAKNDPLANRDQADRAFECLHELDIDAKIGNRLQILEFVVLKEFWIAKVLINPPAATLVIAIYKPEWTVCESQLDMWCFLAGIVVEGRVPKVYVGEMGGASTPFAASKFACGS